ncbi:hypothetical protein RHMOL_Rhmol01G0073100 [Rhododendron molle]|uniref:Uncharacterized protein n=1 Tax=Rhododendron molle TaxID=49168 RepID=A0ACC0PZI0_RHOML|nr:hypothetical protein RHMOL_Rhmol01G0073100 [Rhododendron molle]
MAEAIFSLVLICSSIPTRKRVSFLFFFSANMEFFFLHLFDLFLPVTTVNMVFCYACLEAFFCLTIHKFIVCLDCTCLVSMYSSQQARMSTAKCKVRRTPVTTLYSGRAGAGAGDGIGVWIGDGEGEGEGVAGIGEVFGGVLAIYRKEYQQQMDSSIQQIDLDAEESLVYSYNRSFNAFAAKLPT